MKSTFEEMGGTYRQEGDYLLPNLSTPENPQIGIWGQRRRRYLLENQKPLYTAMLLSGRLKAHLEEVESFARSMFDRLVEQLKHRDGITEEMKISNQLEWVGSMNAIYHKAAEIVIKELICA